MRRYRNRRKNKQRKIIIISICSILLFMTAGYAAMNTNLEINAEGNIIKKPVAELGGIEIEPITDGDGLYADEYEEGRYIYRGTNPNNYVTFNNEIWRIISVETDSTIKILKNAVLEEMAWDTATSCSIAYNGIQKEKDTTIVDNIIYLAPEPTIPGCNDWTRPAELNTYLNETYYNGLLLTAQEQVQSHTWYVGAVTYDNTDLVGQITAEKNNQWTGKVGLITASDYIRANTNTSQCGNFNLHYKNYTICYNTNWMYNKDEWWTISPLASNTYGIFSVNSNGSLNNGRVSNSSIATRPSVYLKSDIKITGGDGSETDPYILEI